MKTLSLRAFALVLVLGAQAFAQRFTAGEPDIFTGYVSNSHQMAVLGEKNSSYADLMLVGGQDTALLNNKMCTYNAINSNGNTLGRILPIRLNQYFVSSSGDSISDNCALAAVVLDSLSNSKKSATVLFSSQKTVVLMQISIDNANNISSSILKSMSLPENMWKMDLRNGAEKIRRLALIGVDKNGNDKIYNLAFGNPHSNCENYVNCGRVDFFSISENPWTLIQRNTKGLSSGENGFLFSLNAKFGTDLAVIDNLGKKGGKALAVLLPLSKQYLKSAIYLFFMDNDWTPSAKLPIIITENSAAWLEDQNENQNCSGLNAVLLKDGNLHLLLSCYASEAVSTGSYANRVFIKDIILDSSGNILNSSSLFSIYADKLPTVPSFMPKSNPIAIKNHKNDLHSISFSMIGPSSQGSIVTFPIIDADYSKNFSIEAGKYEIIANIDSLFYKSGTTGYLAKTLFGSAKCEIQSKRILCSASENAIGSWSGIELSSSSGCDPYKACKRKDTIYVYAHSQKESPNTALRIPKSILVPYYEQINLSDIKSLSYFRNPALQNTNISWNAAGLKMSAVSGSLENGFLIIPFSQKEGIDTLVFNLSISASTYNHPILLRIADSSKISSEEIPANPGRDTVWNIAAKKYIALPPANSKGERYTYDIAQNGLGAYAEVVGDYLHILKVDVAEIDIAYTENSEITSRKITLMPEAKPLPSSSSSSSNSSGEREKNPKPTPIHSIYPGNLKAFYSRGGLQIDGISGYLEIRSYDFKGNEIQMEKVRAKGSVFVKLNKNCPQIVQISTPNKKTYISIFPIDGTSRHN